MTNDKIAAITAQFTKDIPDGSSLALQQALKNIPDEAYSSIVAIQTKLTGFISATSGSELLNSYSVG